MYTGFGFFLGLPFLAPQWRSKVDGNQYLRSTFIFVMCCSRHSYIYVFGQLYTTALPITLHPFNTSIVPRSHVRLLCTWYERDTDRGTQEADGRKREKERRGESAWIRCVTNGSRVNDQGPGRVCLRTI